MEISPGEILLQIFKNLQFRQRGYKDEKTIIFLKIILLFPLYTLLLLLSIELNWQGHCHESKSDPHAPEFLFSTETRFSLKMTHNTFRLQNTSKSWVRFPELSLPWSRTLDCTRSNILHSEIDMYFLTYSYFHR